MMAANHFLLITLLMASIMVCVSFFTLYERKLLSACHLRYGPVNTSMSGMMQPFSDAIKLFTKEILSPNKSNPLSFIVSPLLAVTSVLMLILSLPGNSQVVTLNFSVFIVFVACTFSVYCHFVGGWSSNSVYSIIGSLRSVAQSVSYEIGLAFLFTSFLIFSSEFNASSLSLDSIPMSLSLLSPIVFGCWILCITSECGRAPFDFPEGESELVSGFNIEYGGVLFALLFIAEYSSMIVFSTLTALVFFSCSLMSYNCLMLTLIFMHIYVALRCSYPRSRYDKFMKFCWFLILPLCLYSSLLHLLAVA